MFNVFVFVVGGIFVLAKLRTQEFTKTVVEFNSFRTTNTYTILGYKLYIYYTPFLFYFRPKLDITYKKC